MLGLELWVGTFLLGTATRAQKNSLPGSALGAKSPHKTAPSGNVETCAKICSNARFFCQKIKFKS